MELLSRPSNTLFLTSLCSFIWRFRLLAILPHTPFFFISYPPELINRLLRAVERILNCSEQTKHAFGLLRGYDCSLSSWSLGVTYLEMSCPNGALRTSGTRPWRNWSSPRQRRWKLAVKRILRVGFCLLAIRPMAKRPAKVKMSSRILLLPRSKSRGCWLLLQEKICGLFPSVEVAGRAIRPFAA